MIGDAILFGIKRIDALRGDGHDSLVGPSPLVDLRAKEGYSLKDFLLVIFHTQFSTCFKSAVEAIRVNGEDPFKTATHKELTQIGPIFRFRWGRAHFPFSFLVCTEARLTRRLAAGLQLDTPTTKRFRRPSTRRRTLSSASPTSRTRRSPRTRSDRP